MKKNSSNTQFNKKFRQQMNSICVEKRNQPRREQSDRREIERFGYDITTRRSGLDRRKFRDDWKSYEMF